MDKINFILSLLLLLSLMFSCEDTVKDPTASPPDIETLQSQYGAATQQLQLDEARQSLESQRQNLDVLKAQLAQQSQQYEVVYPAQIAAYNTQILNYTDVLQSLKSAENDVNQATAAALRAQSSAAQVARDQIEPQISQLENDIVQTKQQIYVWTNNTFALTPEQRQLLTNLQNSLGYQQQQLDVLKAERVNISAQILSQNLLIDSASQQQKTEIANEQAILQNEIFTLRGEINRLQAFYSQTRMSLVPLNQQLEQAQKLYDDQQKRVRELEATLNPK